MRLTWIAVGLLATGACSPPNRTFNRVPFPPMASISCTMKVVHDGVLNPTYYRSSGRDDLLFVFSDMDAVAGKARVEGNQGSETVEYRRARALTGEQMQFLETTLAGNLNVTTVFAPPAPGAPMPVVHSRHLAVAPANVAISQFAGECVVKR